MLLVDKFIAVLNILLYLFYLDYLVISVNFTNITMFQIYFTDSYKYFPWQFLLIFNRL
jgi:hypothetical protein